MATHEINTKLGILGEQEYKAKLNEALNSVKLLGLEVKENTQLYKLNADSMQGNAERIALLNKEIEQQKKVIELYTDKIAANEAAGKGNTKEQQRLQESLVKARTALAAMNNDLSETNQKMPTLSDKVKEAASSVKDGLGKALEVAGKAAIATLAAMGTAAVSAGKAIYDLTGQAGQYADKILTMSQTTGVAAEDLQKWEYAGQFIDVSVDTITSSLTKMTKSMGSSSKETTEAFERLGVSVTDVNGNMRDNQDVFFEVVDALGGIANETERDQLAMQLLGRSAQELNPMILSGSEAFKQLGEDAKSAGLIMSDESLNAFGKYDDAMNQMQSTLTAAGRSIAEMFLPAMQDIIECTTGVIQAFVAMVQGAEDGEQKFNEAISTMIEKVTKLINDWLPKVLEMGINILMSLIDGILKAIPKLSESLPQVITSIITFIMNNLPKIVEAGVKIIVALAQGVVAAIPELVGNIPAVLSAIVQALMEGVGELMNVGANLIKGLWQGMLNALSSLWDGLKKLGSNIIDFMKGLFGIHSPSTVMRDQIGKPLAQGIAVGIESGKGAIEDAFKDVMPDMDDLSMTVNASARAAYRPLSAQPVASSIANGAFGGIAGMSASDLAGAVVSALEQSGFADQTIVLNGREVGRYMRRGLEVGFV